jgi:hypothetical protein
VSAPQYGALVERFGVIANQSQKTEKYWWFIEATRKQRRQQ